MAYTPLRFPTPASIQHSKRDRAPAPHCKQLAPWLRLCWIDIVVISIVIATIVYVLWGIPLTIRMWRICRGRPPNTPPSSPASSPPQPSPSSPAMPTAFKSRRETLRALHLRAGSLPAENEKHSILASPPTPTPCPAASTSKDPYMRVNSSLDDSLLLREGLIAPTTRPEPALNAYDSHAPFASPPTPLRNLRRHSDAILFTPGQGQGLGLRLTELPLPPLTPLPIGRRSAGSRRSEGGGKMEEREMGAGTEELVLPPPPAYSKYPIGQGKGRKNPYDAD